MANPSYVWLITDNPGVMLALSQLLTGCVVWELLGKVSHNPAATTATAACMAECVVWLVVLLKGLLALGKVWAFVWDTA